MVKNQGGEESMDVGSVFKNYFNAFFAHPGSSPRVPATCEFPSTAGTSPSREACPKVRKTDKHTAYHAKSAPKPPSLTASLSNLAKCTYQDSGQKQTLCRSAIPPRLSQAFCLSSCSRGQDGELLLRVDLHAVVGDEHGHLEGLLIIETWIDQGLVGSGKVGGLDA